MELLFALIGLALLGTAYVVLNIVLLRWLMSTGRALLLSIFDDAKRFSRVQLKSLTPMRVWTTSGLLVLVTLMLGLLILQPLDLLSLASLLLGYVFIVSALTLSILIQFPAIRAASNEVVFKLGLIAFPIFFGFIAKGYATAWVANLIESSPVSSGIAVFAATGFLLCLVAAAALTFAALLFEVAMMLSVMVDHGRTKHGIGLMLLAFASFVGTLAASNAAIQLPSSRLGDLMLSAIIFEFDASPSLRCDLSPGERELALGASPQIKALYFASTQEKAILVRRDPDLFQPVLLKTLRANDKANYLRFLRVTECLKVSAPDSYSGP